MRSWLVVCVSAGLSAAAGAAARGPAVQDLGRAEIQWLVSSSGGPPEVPAVLVDPDLEPGFPVQTLHTGGSYHGGPAIHVLVAQLDSDPELEIVRTALASGPLYAWNHDGSPLAGWPTAGVSGAAYPVWGLARPLGPASKRRGSVFSGHWGTPGRLALWRASGSPWLGWPKNSANYVATPPSAADLDGDGGDEFLLEEEDWRLHAYHGDGTLPGGWPAYQPVAGQERHTPAIADLDGDGLPEVLTVGGWSNGNTALMGYHADGSVVTGFPVTITGAYVDTFPVVGDVDGDTQLEIVVVHRGAGGNSEALVLSTNGALERALPATGGAPYGTAPALADLDGDGTPEIVVQTDSSLEVFRGTGGTYPGWPVALGGSQWLGSSAPVVGDVTGDGQPDIAITTQVGGSASSGDVRVFHRDGTLVAGFPKALPIGAGAVPAIADIDLDGRNELVVGDSYWDGASGNYDSIWAYDLHGANYGPVLWGQFMGGPRHQGRYGQPLD